MILLFALSVLARNVQQTEAVALTIGSQLHRDIAGGHKHAYSIAIQEGQFASIVIDHRGIDLFVRLNGPDGKMSAQFDDELRPNGQEKPELVAAVSGTYRIEIEPRKQNAPGGNYSITLAELRPSTENDRSLMKARSLFAESQALWRAGKYDEALVPAKAVIAAREQVLGFSDPQVAAAYNNLGIIYSVKGDLEQADRAHRHALAMRQKTLGPDHPGVASSLNNVAEIHRMRGEYSSAEKMYRLSIAGWEKALEPDHPFLAMPLTNLAIVRVRAGDYLEGESLYRRALGIREKALGPQHSDIGASYNNLGVLYLTKGDHLRAEEMFERAVSIWEKSLGANHPNVAAALDNLAEVSWRQGETDKAERFLERSRSVWEKTVGVNHPSYATSTEKLGLVFYDRGELDKAEEVFERTLQIRTAAFGPQHPDIAYSLEGLGAVANRRGDFTTAQEHYERALELRERALGPDHPKVSEALSDLVPIHVARKESRRAIELQKRANEIAEYNIARNVEMGSERQKLAYLTTLRKTTDNTISLHAITAPDDADALTLAITTILQRKGRVQDAMSDSLSALRRRSNAEDQKLIDDLNDTTGMLAGLVLAGPQKRSLSEHQSQIASLEKRKEEIENEIGRRTAGFYGRGRSVTVSNVASALPRGSALLEFAAYRPMKTSTAQGQSEKAHYVVYVLRDNGQVAWKDLGRADAIDGAIDSFRSALRDAKRNDVMQLSRLLDARVIEPVRPLLEGANRLFISADGPLNLIPFEALVDKTNHYLVEMYPITYLTSGRDLLHSRNENAIAGKPLVLANPNFGEPNAMIATARAPRAARRRNEKRQSVTTGSSLESVYFAPLAATAQEAGAIKNLFPQSTVLTGEQASETAVKGVSAPSIVHIATHGFFINVEESANIGAARAATASMNPLLRSGLALAGANRQPEGVNDGILTAFEASGLNLWGTRLVVLSACDTGLGEIRNGEGVYGLRRAFVLAGAETIVMSLWPVSDYATQGLMSDYYAGLKQGLGRGDALRQVQLKMIRSRARRHPYYWASFIQSGEWRELK